MCRDLTLLFCSGLVLLVRMPAFNDCPNPVGRVFLSAGLAILLVCSRRSMAYLSGYGSDDERGVKPSPGSISGGGTASPGFPALARSGSLPRKDSISWTIDAARLDRLRSGAARRAGIRRVRPHVQEQP